MLAPAASLASLASTIVILSFLLTTPVQLPLLGAAQVKLVLDRNTKSPFSTAL